MQVLSSTPFLARLRAQRAHITLTATSNEILHSLLSSPSCAPIAAIIFTRFVIGVGDVKGSIVLEDQVDANEGVVDPNIRWAAPFPPGEDNTTQHTSTHEHTRTQPAMVTKQMSRLYNIIISLDHGHHLTFCPSHCYLFLTRRFAPRLFTQQQLSEQGWRTGRLRSSPSPTSPRISPKASSEESAKRAPSNATTS